MSSPGSESDYGQLDHSTHTLPRSGGKAKGTDTHTARLRVDGEVLNRFLQERRVQDMQLTLDEMAASYQLEEDEILEGDDETDVVQGLLEVSQTTSLVLAEVLQLVLDVQKDMRQMRERVFSLEADISRSPQPKTSCGFSCSNNSVTID